MKKILFLLFLLSQIFCQSYKIKILGFHTTDVTQIIHDSGKIEFVAQNRGLLDMIWPTKNDYSANYDSKTFNLKSWGKNIQQGTYKNNLFAIIDSNKSLIYNKKQKILISEPVHTIFTMIAMVQSKTYDELDTKWFNYEHEGKLGKARFVWSDSSFAWNGKDSILCDHYRLDININDSLNTILKSTDYFMKYIIKENFVRELWVSKTKRKIIIAAKVKTPWFTLIAQLNSNKEHW